MKSNERLNEVYRRLLFSRRWSFLRYLHLREGFTRAGSPKTMLSVGAGRGIAEIGLAVEFPGTQFHLTDIQSSNTPNYRQAQELAKAWKLDNVSFGVLDILSPPPSKYALIASVEVLEHIESDGLAAANMRAMSSDFVFVLVPFADKHAQYDRRLLEQAWNRHEHFKVGYDARDLTELFPQVLAMRGCYWRQAGQVWRRSIRDASDGEVLGNVPYWSRLAEDDVLDAVPKELSEAQGIWALASVRGAAKPLNS